MARRLAAIDLARCWELVASRPWGRLAVTVEGHPEVFPVNHLVEDRTLLFCLAEGTKLRRSLGTRVAFQVDEIAEDQQEGWSVLLVGYAEEDYGRGQQPGPRGLDPWWTDEPVHWIRVVPVKVTGRRIDQVGPASPT